MPKAKQKPRDLDKATVKWFEDQATQFKGILKHAILISNKVGRVVETPPRGFATWLWMRTIITGQSIERLLRPHISEFGGTYLDQASIASLCRSLMESVAVMRYIGDIDISEPEWKCRHYVIQLYDVIHRREFLQLFGHDAGATNTSVATLTKKLRANPAFTALPGARQKRLLKGDDMFVDGRMNALLTLGWGPEFTKGAYKYLSIQSHSQPMAFQRTHDNRLFEKDSPYARFVAAFGLSWGRLALGFGCMHMLKLFPRIEDHFDPFILTALKKEYAQGDGPQVPVAPSS